MNPENHPPTSSTPPNGGPHGPAVPVWLIVVMFLLLYWGALYFDQHSGWFDARVYSPYRTLAEVNQYQPVTGGPNIFLEGQAIYGRTCIACHQANGQGAPGQFPPLAGSNWVNEKEPGRMIRIVLQGLHGGPIQINGQPFSTGSAMVPWNMLSDDDLAAVITFVRQNKEWGNHAPAVTPAQIHAIRAKVKDHPNAFTPQELLNISPSE